MHDFTKLYRMDLPHRALSVYIYLSDRANKDGICWPSIPTIAKDLKLSERTYHCSCCGFTIDRDKNASINLAKYKLA